MARGHHQSDIEQNDRESNQPNLPTGTSNAHSVAGRQPKTTAMKVLGEVASGETDLVMFNKI